MQDGGSWGHWGDVEGMGRYWRAWVGAAVRFAGEMLSGWRWLSWCRGRDQGGGAVLMPRAGGCRRQQHPFQAGRGAVQRCGEVLAPPSWQSTGAAQSGAGAGGSGGQAVRAPPSATSPGGLKCWHRRLL